MGDNNTLQSEPLNDPPSVYRLWQQAQREKTAYGDQLDRYRELLEKYGHRSEGAAKWTAGW